MNLKIYNSQTKKKEIFQPHQPPQVKMYVCGPTVYNLLHVGNFRGIIFFNLVRNWLEHLGYKVTFVLNYTDIDDRIIHKALEEKVSHLEISEKYIHFFEEDFSKLKIKKHDKNPKVTDFVEEIITFIQNLINKGKAYVVDNEVLYSIKSFHEYGKLSHRNTEDLHVGVRINPGEKKKDPLDFTLWKPAKENEPRWTSPWGEGRPGWHIECSAMIHSLLGEQIDIHGGGMDLIFPHHENEIAQSEGLTGKSFVKYWMHNNMLNLGGTKMSKSLGNILTAREFLSSYHPEILKYLLLNGHYRSELDFSDESISKSIRELARFYSALHFANSISALNPLGSTSISGPASNNELTLKVQSSLAREFEKFLCEADQQISDSLNDDFSTPQMFATCFEVVRNFNSKVKRGSPIQEKDIEICILFKNWLLKWGTISSLFQEESLSFLTFLDDMLLEKLQVSRSEIEKKVAERTQARAIKDFKKSDEIRDKLTEMGVSISDTLQGTFWEVTK